MSHVINFINFIIINSSSTTIFNWMFNYSERQYSTLEYGKKKTIDSKNA